MTAPTKRRDASGKFAKKNPDCEPASKGYVKCLMRQYHEQQTVKNMEFQKECCALEITLWIIVTLAIGCFYIFTGIEGAAFLAVVSGFFIVNSIMKQASLGDSTNYSEKHVDFMQKYEPPCEPKRGCEERE